MKCMSLKIGKLFRVALCEIGVGNHFVTTLGSLLRGFLVLETTSGSLLRGFLVLETTLASLLHAGGGVGWFRKLKN